MIKLAEAEWLPETLKAEKSERPWQVDRSNVAVLRERLPKWLNERYGIVVYECKLMDSSQAGQLTFAPRMFDSVEQGWVAAQRNPHRDSVAGCGSLPVDWICREAFSDGWNMEQVLDACFYYEDEDGNQRRLGSDEVWSYDDD